MKKYRAIFLILVYWAILYFLNPAANPNPDHIKMGMLVIILAALGSIEKFKLADRILKFLAPFVWTGVIYDSQRYYSDYIRGRIRVEEPYLFDKTFFGIRTLQGILTPNEWCQLHTTVFLDLLTGFFYLTFIGLYIGIAAWFYFYLSKKSEKVAKTAFQMNWSFFWTNLLGYTTYYWYPAAPPWYVALHGLGPADLSVRSNPAGTIRFDHALGTHFFTGMYGRSADVFGAIPSLHIAYPLIAVCFAIRYKSLRAFSIFFYLIMCFAAVYLNHHYILDIIWGSAYALLVTYLIDLFYKKKEPKLL